MYEQNWATEPRICPSLELWACIKLIS